MKNWWKYGVAFSCQRCAKCCHARDGIAYVYVNRRERAAIAAKLEVPLATFDQKYVDYQDHAKAHVKFVGGKCMFLKNNQCSINAVKPTQCRTWPFWEEIMVSQESYKQQVLDFCPGSQVSQPTIAPESIADQIQETEDAFFEV
ncbi:MAG: YkgJ family cysteine cluster protein [Planctomycetota bacterium]|jgi:hypothetical protein|nr:YkgJ family cysteine cluster protein [Planctomycetota bacterium]